jgi:hypothetical protein
VAVAVPDLRELPFPGFAGGINLRDQPTQVDPAQAVDLLNVTFTDRGGVRSRDGYARFTAASLTNRPDSLGAYYTSGGTAHLVVGNAGRLDALNTLGASVANTTATASPHFFARFGSPTAELLFISNGTDPLRQWNGTAFSTPTFTGTTPTGRYLAVTPWDNRLVNARYAGTAAGNNPSTVRFSDPGVPTTFAANNYVDLTPGDGEAIQGVVSWLNYVLVFKETKFFVFAGTSTSATGTPIFPYRPVDNRVGLSAPRAVTAARDGVYFVGQRGVYRTQGTTVELVSQLLDPFFYGNPPDSFRLSQTLNQSAIQSAVIAVHREQVYVAVPTGTSTTNNRMLVFDPRYGWWSIYDIPAAAMVMFKAVALSDLMFAYAVGTNDVGRHAVGQTTDAGATIPSRCRYGWWDGGQTGLKMARESLVWGKGRVQFGVRTDFGVTANTQNMDFGAAVDLWADGTNSADTWGDGSNPSETWGAGVSITPRLNRQAWRGTMMSMELSNVDATPWAVHRVTHHLMPINPGRLY